MHSIQNYYGALKSIKKRYFLTPFLILMYLFYGQRMWIGVTSFIESDYTVLSDYFRFIISFIFVYGLIFLQVLFYPHSSYFIQTNKVYTTIFNKTKEAISSGFTNYFSIGNNIPDDIYLTDRRSNRTFRVSAGAKSKAERVGNARVNYLIYFYAKFIFIDCALRLMVHGIVFFFSPIIFLIAVPSLRKRNLIGNLEN